MFAFQLCNFLAEINSVLSGSICSADDLDSNPLEYEVCSKSSHNHCIGCMSHPHVDASGMADSCDYNLHTVILCKELGCYFIVL
jgi:hypothetical protein